MITYYEFKEIKRIEEKNIIQLNKNHKFLYENITNKIKYYENSLNKKEYISFFDKVYFEIEKSAIKPKKFDFFACHIYKKDSNDQDIEISDLEISQKLRNSKTLTIDSNNCYDLEHLKIVYSESGFIFIAKKFDEQKEMFEKTYILYLLAHAYNLYTENLMEEISICHENNNFKKMVDLRKEIYIFDLNYFFANPVNYKKQQLHTIWTYLNSIYKIEKNREEMKSQVKDLVELIEIELKEIAEEKNKSKTFWLTVFGLLITMFSLVSAYKDVKEMGWISNENSINEKKDK